MSMKQEKRVSEVMNSLKGIQRAKAPNNSITIIQAKLAEQRKEQQTIKKQSGFEWLKVAAVIGLLVCSNIWAVSSYWKSEGLSAGSSSGYPQLMTDFNLYENE